MTRVKERLNLFYHGIRTSERAEMFADVRLWLAEMDDSQPAEDERVKERMIDALAQIRDGLFRYNMGDFESCAKNAARLALGEPIITRDRPTSKKLFDELIQIAGALVRCEGFISPYADDNPKSTPRAILEKVEQQQTKLKDLGYRVRQVANQILSLLPVQPAQPALRELFELLERDKNGRWCFKSLSKDADKLDRIMEQLATTVQPAASTPTVVNTLRHRIQELRAVRIESGSDRDMFFLEGGIAALENLLEDLEPAAASAEVQNE